MTTNDSPELRRCPFCGSETKILRQEESYRKYMGYCSKGCFTTSLFFFKRQVIKILNNRYEGAKNG